MDDNQTAPQVITQFQTVAFWVGVVLVIAAWKFGIEGLIEG